MPTSTVENYLKRLYMLEQRVEGKRAAMGAVAKAAGVTAGTATTMIKNMADAGLVDYAARDGVRLTAQGKTLALSVLRRHRIIELFLVEQMGYDWSEVHDEAEELEHAISDKLLERMDAMLGHPAFDPHGDPIPDAIGHMAGRMLQPLDEATTGSVRVARVVDDDPAFLRHVETLNLTPGKVIQVVKVDHDSKVIHLKLPSGQAVLLGLSAARQIQVVTM